MIRDNLFSIQVKQLWLILQYGNSNVKELGEEMGEELLYFFMISFLQIVTFAVIYLKLVDIMGRFSLHY